MYSRISDSKLNIQNNANQTIMIATDGNGKAPGFNVDLNFTPDEVKVTACIINDTVLASPFNIISFKSPIVQNSFLCICNGASTFNPTYSFINVGGNSFNGTHTIDVFDETEGTTVVALGFVLHFEFIRYKNDFDKK